MTPTRTAGVLTVSVVLASGCGLLQHSAALTFQVGNVECTPAKSANPLGQVCSFLAFYGNISKHTIQVEPATTMVLDKTGKTFLPTADNPAGTFVLKPGQQQQVSWSVALPSNTRPTKVRWHGSAVDVQFQVPGAIGPPDSAAPSSAVHASAEPSAPAPSSPAPSTAVAPTTPVPASSVPTTTKAVPTTKTTPKPTKTTPKPSKTPAAPTTPVQTTTRPTTTPPPTRTRHTTPPVHHTTAPSTTPPANSSNPGGGIGHIG